MTDLATTELLARHCQPLAARVAALEAGLRIALAAIDDHNETSRSRDLVDYYETVPTGSKITCLSDARALLGGQHD